MKYNGFYFWMFKGSMKQVLCEKYDKAYAERLGVSELMPLFCELDAVMITLQHGVLHRAQTLASGGAYCDYFITGDKE